MDITAITGAVTITNGVLLAVIIGLTQLFKGYVPERLWALAPVALGILAGGIFIAWTSAGILTGVILGLTANGLYDQKQIAKTP